MVNSQIPVLLINQGNYFFFFSKPRRYQNQFQHMNVWPGDSNSFRAKQVCLTHKLLLTECNVSHRQIPPNWTFLSTQLIQSKPCKLSSWENAVPYPIPQKNLFVKWMYLSFWWNRGASICLLCLSHVFQHNQLLSCVLKHVGPTSAVLK